MFFPRKKKLFSARKKFFHGKESIDSHGKKGGKRFPFFFQKSDPFSGKGATSLFQKNSTRLFPEKSNLFLEKGKSIRKKENKPCCSLTPIVKQVEPR